MHHPYFVCLKKQNVQYNVCFNVFECFFMIILLVFLKYTLFIA